MSKKNGKQRAVCVLGMHRSGTSLLARTVNLLGAYIGEASDLMQATSANPEGYWEHQRIYEFNVRVLSALDRSWDTPFPLAPEWHKSAELKPFHDELIELVETIFRDQPIWAWKDPRTCVLLPLWRAALTELNIDLSCLLVTRNPLDVARSLNLRDGFSIQETFGLWFNHGLAMLDNSRDLPRALVGYQSFLADPKASIASWPRRLSIQWPSDDKKGYEAVRQSIRSDLCHSASDLTDLSQAGCPKPVFELAQILDAMAANGDPNDPVHEPEISRLTDNHASYSGIFIHGYVPAFRRKDLLGKKSTGQKIPSDDGQIKQMQARVAKLETSASHHHSQIEEMKHELGASQKTIETQANGLKDQESRLKDQDSRLKDQESRLSDQESRLSDQESRLSDQENHLKEQENRLRDQDNSLKEQAILLKREGSEIAELVKKLNVMRVDLDSRTAEITELRRANKHLESAREQVKERFQEIANLSSVLLKRNEQIAKLEHRARFMPGFVYDSKIWSAFREYRNRKNFRRDCRLINSSSYFQEEWYLQQYSDVQEAGMTPAMHYLKHGASEGRNPGPDFDTKFYLRSNPDVAIARINPLVHYVRVGKREGRAIWPEQ